MASHPILLCGILPHSAIITSVRLSENDGYPNTRNHQTLHINKTRTVKDRKMVMIIGGKVWNLLNDEMKEDLKHKSTFQFNKMIKNYY